LVQASDGGYALAGYTWSYGYGLTDLWLLKTDASGILQWNRAYGGTGFDAAYALVKTPSGRYALAGFTDSYGAGGSDFWLVRTDGSGTMLFNKTYGGTGEDIARALVQTSDGGYALAGYTNSSGAGDYDFWLIKTDWTGNEQWNKTYGGTSYDGAYALVQTVDGGYALAGGSYSWGAGSCDMLLIKTDVESGLAWVDSSADAIWLHRGATDVYWNFVRIRIWKPKPTP
jgi:hypothetical protein